MNKETMAICSMNCKSSSVTISLIIFFFVFTTSSATSPTYNFQTYYADHCASLVPKSTPIGNARPQYNYLYTGYYTRGGSGSSSPISSYDHVQNSVKLNSWGISETNVQGLFKLQAVLKLQKASAYYYEGNSTGSLPQYPGSFFAYNRSGSIQFSLNGFWSETSGKVCMVGFGIGHRGDNLRNLHVVLKLHNLMNSTGVTSLTSGTLESLTPNGPNNFEPVSILLLPGMNYKYSLVSDISDSSSSGGTGSDDLHPPSSLDIEKFCLVLSQEALNLEFDLKYSSHCSSSKNCNPLAVSDLPRVVSLKAIVCLEEEKRLRVLVEFSGNRNLWYRRPRRPFDPNTTLVGEGAWDAKNNQLSVVACKFLDATDSLNNTHVGDCSTRITLRFPAIWTIGNTSSILGHIWSNKTVTASGYFEKITFESVQDGIGRALVPGLKYEYTKTDKATKLCPKKKAAHGKTNVYPTPFSYDMRFDVSAKNSKGEEAWGNAVPLSVGNRFHQSYWWYSMEDENSYVSTEASVSSAVTVDYSFNQSNPYNISYKVSIKILSSDAKSFNSSIVNEMQISAEGIYDATDGSLCMVGCRNLGSKTPQPTNDSVDCEIAVNFQFPPTNPTKSLGAIKGSIKSTRETFDPLHFESWDLSSVSGYLAEERRSIWRMDVEITLVLISTTLACVFVALQLFHVKKYPDVLPSISIFMLLVLTLGYMTPLMLNFEAMFKNSSNRQNVFLGSGGWIEVNEVIVRVTTMVAFLLQIRLLQLTWSKRSANGTRKQLWLMEKKALFVTLPVYAAGALAALLLQRQSWNKSAHNGFTVAYPETGYQENSIVGSALKSYAGLVLDGFLLPQILLNMFSKSTEKALSVSFYIGTTFVRALPHAYDLYRAHNSAHRQLNESYLYASPEADFYSTAWDVIIPFGGLVFAGIIYLQQKFGGACILPKKLRELGGYEKVPTATVTEG